MTILFASGTPHLPQVVGGLELNTHEMALELTRRGHPAAVLARLSPRDAFGASRLLRSALTRGHVCSDSGLGYTVYRTPRPWQRLRGLPRPRIAVVQNGNMVEIGRRFRELGIPPIAYLHGLEFEKAADQWRGGRDALPFAAYIANSRFTARLLRERTGLHAWVIPPLFRAERYRPARPAERRFVTFVNPVPEKGVEVALAVAALLPEVLFRFVRGWPLPLRQAARLRARLRGLPNVTLVGPLAEMGAVYAASRVLLVPSQWPQETWGRVASEAQFAGVPVLGSDVGGLPEAIGPGGTLLPREAAPAIWADEIRRLWTDHAHWQEKSSAALAHAVRPDIDTDRQLAAFLHVVDQVAA